MSREAFLGAAVFDGARLHADHALLIEDGLCRGILPAAEVPSGWRRVPLEGGTVLPGFVDLQVNGGGGVLLNDAPSVEGIRTIAAAHAARGTAAFLPTLVTDTPERTQAAVEAVARAVAEGVPGVLGLHLEGPHLAPARKGAHEAALIRPMEDADEAFLTGAAARLPNLMVTLAPEAVAPERIARLAAAGVIVSLGHSDCSFDAAMAAIAAGARSVTHLFNAMSQLGSREPGLAGAALESGRVSAGLIADGVHVHPATMRAALAAKRGPGRIFLVTDAMAPAGTDLAEFRLNGRRVLRRGGRLMLEDGTLAGADIDMPGALAVLGREVGLPPAEALAMATSRPAAVLRDPRGHGAFVAGRPAAALHLAADGTGVRWLHRPAA
ncbi:MAG: N-acetylglucosamine-6-phosphate deacetylase [Rhodobacteraceae bacterium]|nr:N-acetylglucosamine-6-phosphate deacetylase [Paracoccaceae bacterium]